MSNLNVTLIQSPLHWEAISNNLTAFSKKIEPLQDKTDLIVLPEMFTTGFSMNAEDVAEEMDGSTMIWLKEQAAKLNSAIMGSFIAKEGRQFYNRLIFMKPDGTFFKYDKRHLFTLAKEHHTYQKGEERLVVEWKGWKICPLVCYDLRFPVWSRNTVSYDLLIYVANWPEPRAAHWKALLKARAIENQCYTIGVNRVGTDEKGLAYAGDSSLTNYNGGTLYEVSKVADVFTTSISKDQQNTYRSKLDFLPDQDSFKII